MILSAIKNGLQTTLNSLISNTVVEHNTEMGNSISEKSKLKIMRLNTFIPEYGFLVLINLLVSELCYTLKCDH